MIDSRFTCIGFLVLIISFFNLGAISAQHEMDSRIRGSLEIDDTWDSTIYLAYIATFDDMYRMSNEMIIAKADITRGYFEFDLSFLPVEERLYRLHITRPGDTPASLIIGGKDENHLFLIASQKSNFELRTNSAHPPFKNVNFINSNQNVALQLISALVHEADSTASESTSARRKLIEDKLNKDLLFIADTTENLLISLYAIYNSRFEFDHASNAEYYRTYINKWSGEKSPYLKSFNEQAPALTTNRTLIFGIVAACIFIAIGFVVGRRKSKRNKDFEKLSIQERRVLELLRKGATNQEISNQYNIEISTVKSHVSNILAKLNVKSRREIINLK